MKIAGKSVSLPSIQTVVIPREDGDIIFKLGPVKNLNAEFDKLYPEPNVPVRQKRGQEPVKEYSNPEYLAKIDKRNSARLGFMVIQSLRATEDLEWETVDLNDPNTWENYLTEMRASNLSEVEISEIVKGSIKANALDSDALDEAKDRFLRGLEQQDE